MSLKPTPPLEVAISNDKRMAFQAHLYDVDPSVPGWADDAVKRALYVENRHFFLKELIKKGIKPDTTGEDLFRISCQTDPTGESSRLLLKAGYRPDNSILSLLGLCFDAGKLAQAPALLAALPKHMRQSAMAQMCARAAMSPLCDEDLDKLAKLWKGKPHAASITKQVMEQSRRAKRSDEEIAQALQQRQWLDVSWLEDKDLETPLGRVLNALSEQAVLQDAAPTVARSHPSKRL